MANTLYDSYINPVKFHSLDNIQLSNYVSRFIDDWAFRRTIQPWEQKTCFYQPWVQADTVKIQYTTNFAPIILRMYDRNGLLVHTQSFTTHQQNELDPLFYIRQISVSLAGFDPGKYFFTRDSLGDVRYSEPFEILDAQDSGALCLEDQDPTLYLEFSNDKPYQGIKFFVPFEGAIRIPGILKYKQTSSKDNVYEDQLLNETMINSVPYRLFTLILGGNYGVPPWFVDKIARILGCSNLSIDGRLYTKNEGAQFEPALLEGYPMAGHAIDLRDKLNRDSQIIENDTVITGIAAAALLIDNKGFGIDGGDTSYQQINYLQ
jgi:hypothetical protein